MDVLTLLTDLILEAILEVTLELIPDPILMEEALEDILVATLMEVLEVAILVEVDSAVATQAATLVVLVVLTLTPTLVLTLTLTLVPTLGLTKVDIQEVQEVLDSVALPERKAKPEVPLEEVNNPRVMERQSMLESSHLPNEDTSVAVIPRVSFYLFQLMSIYEVNKSL